MARLRDDWIAAPDWLNEKRCEDFTALQSTACEILMKRNCFRAALGVRRVLASL
jgi:hypothetical protein